MSGGNNRVSNFTICSSQEGQSHGSDESGAHGLDPSLRGGVELLSAGPRRQENARNGERNGKVGARWAMDDEKETVLRHMRWNENARSKSSPRKCTCKPMHGPVSGRAEGWRTTAVAPRIGMGPQWVNSRKRTMSASFCLLSNLSNLSDGWYLVLASRLYVALFVQLACMPRGVVWCGRVVWLSVAEIMPNKKYSKK